MVIYILRKTDIHVVENLILFWNNDFLSISAILTFDTSQIGEEKLKQIYENVSNSWT